MNISLSTDELKQYISMQLNNFFPDKYRFEGTDIDRALDTALERTENCFRYIKLPHYTSEKQIWFNHLHADQYSTFLYFLSNTLWEQAQNKPICDKLMFLVRTLNGLFLSYKCQMPDIFFLNHSIGTFIGNAQFSDFLVISQNVTINTILVKDSGPIIGKGVTIKAGVAITGDTHIGDGCTIEANTLLHDADIADRSTVFMNANGKVCVENISGECYYRQIFYTKADKWS